MVGTMVDCHNTYPLRPQINNTKLTIIGTMIVGTMVGTMVDTVTPGNFFNFLIDTTNFEVTIRTYHRSYHRSPLCPYFWEQNQKPTPLPRLATQTCPRRFAPGHHETHQP